MVVTSLTRNHVSTLEVQTAEKPVTMRVCGQVQIVNWGLFYPVVLPNFHGLNFVTRNHVSTLEVQTAEKPVTMRVCGQVQIVNWGLFYPVVLPNFHGLNFAGKWL